MQFTGGKVVRAVVPMTVRPRPSDSVSEKDSAPFVDARSLLQRRIFASVLL